MRTETLDPGGTVAADFNVLAAHDSHDCIQTGSYRFEDGNYLDEGWGSTCKSSPSSRRRTNSDTAGGDYGRRPSGSKNPREAISVNAAR